MGIFHGDKEIASVQHGDTEIGAVYHGDTLIWESGPSLIGGDIQAGYFGTVAFDDFVVDGYSPPSGEALASAIGLTAGTAYNQDENCWLQFAWNGGIVMVPQKPLRYGISWDQIDAEDAVYGGTGAPVVTINSADYKVRLMRVTAQDPIQPNTEYTEVLGPSNEWNRLMYPIHENVGGTWAYPENVDEENVNDWGADFTDDDLLTDSSFGNGSYSWGQEYAGEHYGSPYRVLRGYYGVSDLSTYLADNTGSFDGWRPLLEKL